MATFVTTNLAWSYEREGWGALAGHKMHLTRLYRLHVRDLPRSVPEANYDVARNRLQVRDLPRSVPEANYYVARIPLYDLLMRPLSPSPLLVMSVFLSSLCRSRPVLSFVKVYALSRFPVLPFPAPLLSVDLARLMLGCLTPSPQVFRVLNSGLFGPTRPPFEDEQYVLSSSTFRHLGFASAFSETTESCR